MISKIRAKVFASLKPGTIDVYIGYGFGMIDGGYVSTFNTEEIPESCRFPNTYLWITWKNRVVIKIEKMNAEDIEKNKYE